MTYSSHLFDLFQTFDLFLFQTYPARHEGDKLVSPSEDSYSHAKDFLQGLQSGKTDSSTSRYRDHREKSEEFVVCAV